MRLFCTVASLKAATMMVYGVTTKVLNTEIFLHHANTDLNHWHYIYCFVLSGEAFTVKGTKHRHPHMLSAGYSIYFELSFLLWREVNTSV